MASVNYGGLQLVRSAWGPSLILKSKSYMTHKDVPDIGTPHPIFDASDRNVPIELATFWSL